MLFRDQGPRSNAAARERSAGERPVPWEDLLAEREYLRKLLLGIVGDAGLAEDLVQETLLVAWLQPPRGGRPVRPWLATVARNLAFKHWRSESRRRRREDRLQEEARPVGRLDPLEQLAWEDLRRDLWRAVEDLPEPYRATLRLSFGEGLSCVDIGRRLGVQADTVNKRKQRALARLRERLDRRYGRGLWAVALLALAAPPAPSAGVALQLEAWGRRAARWSARGRAAAALGLAAGVLAWGGTAPAPRAAPVPAPPPAGLAAAAAAAPRGTVAPVFLGAPAEGSLAPGRLEAVAAGAPPAPRFRPDGPLELRLQLLGKESPEEQAARFGPEAAD